MSEKASRTPRTDALQVALSKGKPCDSITGTGRALVLAGGLEEELADALKALEELLSVSPYRGMGDTELGIIKGDASSSVLRARAVLARGKER